MPKRRDGRQGVKRRRIYRTRFVDLDGDIYLVSDRDAEGFECVKLDAHDAELVRCMRDESEVEMESAVLAKHQR